MRHITPRTPIWAIKQALAQAPSSLFQAQLNSSILAPLAARSRSGGRRQETEGGAHLLKGILDAFVAELLAAPLLEQVVTERRQELGARARPHALVAERLKRLLQSLEGAREQARQERRDPRGHLVHLDLSQEKRPAACNNCSPELCPCAWSGIKQGWEQAGPGPTLWKSEWLTKHFPT